MEGATSGDQEHWFAAPEKGNFDWVSSEAASSKGLPSFSESRAPSAGLLLHLLCASALIIFCLPLEFLDFS